MTHMAGEIYGKVRLVERSSTDSRYWWVRCTCGTYKRIQLGSLTSGRTVSCGCYLRSGVYQGRGGRATWAKLNTKQRSAKARSMRRAGAATTPRGVR